MFDSLFKMTEHSVSFHFVYDVKYEPTSFPKNWKTFCTGRQTNVRAGIYERVNERDETLSHTSKALKTFVNL